MVDAPVSHKPETRLRRAYRDRVVAIFDRVVDDQAGALDTAVKWVSEAWAADRLVYVTGSGHSHILAEEVFDRAGGAAPVQAILDPGLMLHEGAQKSSRLERVEGYAEVVLSEYPIGPGDVMFVASNSGRNAFPVEAALTARRRGARTIAITSIEHASAVTSRHSSGKLLHEVADLAIDNGGEYGDAAIDIPARNARMGPTSTLAGAFILNTLLLEAVALLAARGIVVDLFESANLQVRDGEAADIVGRWRNRIRGL